MLEKIARTNLIKKQETLGTLRYKEFHENKRSIIIQL